MKKALSVIFSLLLLCNICVAASADSVTAEKHDYTITSPYDNVDWDTWGAYKTQLHCHTNASDGFLTIKEAVQLDYDLGYDIVAITDHGTINKGWNKAPDLVPLMRLVKYERTQMADIIPLSDEEYASYLNGTAKTTDGEARGRGMLDIPQGIELNMATPVADCHLTGYWCDYGQGLAGVFGDYETPSKGVKDAGGISMLAHVGEYVYLNYTSDENVGKPVAEKYVNKFARIFLDNPGSSFGMGINSSADEHTNCDRILYDAILQKTIPNGVVPYGYCFSDSHNVESRNYAYQMLLMPSFDLDSTRTALVSGTSFAVSHFSRGVELNGMKEMEKYSVADDCKQFDASSNDTPMVTNISVDNDSDTITVSGINFDTITWISNGNVIKREKTENNTVSLDLNDSALLDDIGMYIRFYITGDEGICYSQPFTVIRDNEEPEPVNVPKTHDESTFLRGLVTVLDWAIFKWSPFIWAFKWIALGYNPLEQIVSSFRNLDILSAIQ